MSAETRAPSTGWHALVVDDDPLIRSVLASSLTQVGFHVAEAANGLECLALTSRQNFEVIFMDIVMPEKDGLATTLDLRQAGVKVPIIVITALDKIGDTMLLEAARRFGATDAIKKPFNPLEVARMAQRIVLGR